jgi:hypothetical protein
VVKIFHPAAIAVLAFAAMGCEEQKPTTAANEPAAVQPANTPPPVPSVSAQVDWEAARADLAKRPSDVVVPQSVGDAPLTVPMLLPEIVQTASDRPTPPHVMSDGYVANYHLAKYDVIVNGSNKAYQAGGQGQQPADKAAMKFQTVEGGAQLAFSRYGADYLIEFECREMKPEGCITRQEAEAFAESLFVAQTR